VNYFAEVILSASTLGSLSTADKQFFSFPGGETLRVTSAKNDLSSTPQPDIECINVIISEFGYS
jgi:hypothetical protein